jgi:hypothetical protein
MEDRKVKYLNEEQRERLYDVFDFEDYEKIEDAWIDNGQLYIYFLNEEDSENYTYEPNLDGEEGKEKLRHILDGTRGNTNENADFEEIYSKRYDYDDLKIAMVVQDYFKDCPIEKLQKFDFMVDYEDYVYLVNTIKEQWQAEKGKYENEEEADIDGEEIGYIQVYAYRYLEERYKWAKDYNNTKKVLDLIKEEYEKECEKTNPSNAQDFLQEILAGIQAITRQTQLKTFWTTSNIKTSKLIGVHTGNDNLEYSGYLKEEGESFSFVVVLTTPELEILEEIEEIKLDGHITLDGAHALMERWIETFNEKLEKGE